MTDVFSKEQRSWIMGRVKGSGNKTTELALIALFRKYRITGWRRGSNLPGRPDFVFPTVRVAIFADGCFWHGHDCRNTQPLGNGSFWREKVEKNRKRDRRVSRKLRSMGWSVYRIWECRIKKRKLPATLLAKVGPS
ncbi:very short patch repair endonuclease [Leptonema illini]|uniref:T/G mismatch-specific endonuclease n=1 Tax=Leptonema illini DSM 21528 TaxID=929563 RepID=H2CGF6_9LEPT|nr:very short patch repair endonuclease [Leptonema illini]EHQ06871.1 T/G mismatch-specific endonuclease [Leptonema illini DSM 21528]